MPNPKTSLPAVQPKKRLTPEETVALLATERDTFLQSVQVKEITTQEEYATIAEVWKRTKDLTNRIETTRKAVVGPFNLQIKAVNDLFHHAAAPLVTVTDACQQAMSKWSNVLAAKDAERQRLLNEESKRQFEEKQKAGIGTPLPVAVAPQVAETPRKIETASGTVSMIDNWKVTVTDEAAVPPEFRSVDLKKLQLAVDGCARAIAGCYVYNEPFPRGGRG